MDPELRLEGARRLQLPFGVVDADRAGAAAGEPGGDVAGAAAELDRVAPLDLPRQHPDFRLGHGEDSPERFLALPVAPPLLDVAGSQLVPDGAIAGDVLR